jgi:hypothetical protein
MTFLNYFSASEPWGNGLGFGNKPAVAGDIG